MIAFDKKSKASKYCGHLTIRHIPEQQSLIAKVEKKIEDILGEDQFEFRKGKGNRNAIGILRIISERSLDFD